jgi:hypothetical protein
MASNTLSLPRKRRAVTNDERITIRRRNREHPSPHQGELITWFHQETGHQLDQSQISRILSSKYDYLDTLDPKKDKAKIQSQRISLGDWPELEGALYEWQQGMQKKRAVITGDILKEQAIKLWKSLPQYQDCQQPKFSNGWLDGFKKRFKIREYVQHGEAGSADIHNPEAISQMEKVRTLATAYDPCNVLNMDETGLFWKLTPDRTLATMPGSGGKKSKDRITLAFTCSATGEKLQPWVIGKSKNPRCFKNINKRLLRIEYRHNKSKWMTGLIMEEYLRWLDNKMRVEGRKVLLLLDNFSGHELGVQLVGGLEGLDNVRIEWLPANTTSYWQPLDQGIIASFKLQYRAQWVAYMLRQYEANKDPNQTVNLLKAIQWTRLAWDQGVSEATIQKCWWKSTIIKKPVDQEVEDQYLQQERDKLQAQILQLPNISELLSVDEYISLPNEVVEDEEEDIFESIIDRYSVDTEDIFEELEEGDIEEEKVPINDAIKALETLKLFEIQQEDGAKLFIQALDQADRRYMQKQYQSRKQTTIDSFFQNK